MLLYCNAIWRPVAMTVPAPHSTLKHFLKRLKRHNITCHRGDEKKYSATNHMSLLHMKYWKTRHELVLKAQDEEGSCHDIEKCSTFLNFY